MPDKAAKPQPTLNAYAAWVISRLAEAKGNRPAQVAKWIIERWIDENGQLLAEEFLIKRTDYRGADDASTPKRRRLPKSAKGD